MSMVLLRFQSELNVKLARGNSNVRLRFSRFPPHSLMLLFKQSSFYIARLGTEDVVAHAMKLI